MVIFACLPGEARAEGPRVLFVAPVTTPFSARVRAEIEAMGFTVEPAEALDVGAPPSAVAAARVIEAPPPRRVELWIVAAGSGRFERRSVIQPAEDDDEETQTVRASEQLRAFFQPLHAPAPGRLGRARPPLAAPAPEAAVLPEIEEPPAPPAPSRFVAGAVIAVPFQPGGAGVDLALRFRWMATRVIGLGALVSVPIAGTTVSAAQGSTSVSVPIFGAELTAVILDARPVRLAVSAGFGAAWLRTTGTAISPYVSRSDSVVVGLPFLGVEVAPRLTDHLRLYVGGHVGVSVPRADCR
jgi:hypothetical protein